MKIEQHIRDLLFRYDCVIVPGLGGFVANYAPAKIHPSNHVFSPPSKDISFNKNLMNNDGLLAHSISSSGNVSYEEAGRLIRFFVLDIQHDLKRKKRVKLPDVGTLFLDNQYNLQFEPDASVNYLEDSFGLAPVQFPPAKRESVQKKIERRIERKLSDRPPVPAQRKRINVRKYVAYALSGALLLSALIIIPLKMDVIRGFSYSNLNPFTEKYEPVYSSRTEPVHEFNAELLTEVPAAMPPAAVVAESTDVYTEAPAGENKYHVITGCFRIRENAERYIGDMKLKGIASSVIGRNDEGLYIVSSGDFSNREEARSTLAGIRNTQPQAWLLVK